MSTKVNENHEKAIIIDGVILTKECLERLENFQEHDNENMSSCRETIADAICFIGKNLDGVQADEFKKLHYLITDLSFIRDYLGDFRKP